MSTQSRRVEPPRHPSILEREDSGVSAVIGAVLIFGLFSSAFVIWSFTTLPVWIGDNEEVRNLQAEQSFSSLSNGLDLLAVDGSAGPLTSDFPLSADEVPLLQPVPSTGQIRYEDGFDWAATFTSATSHMVDGIVDGLPITTNVNGASINNIASLEALTFAIDGSGGSSITMTAADGYSHSVVGTFTLTGGGNCPGNALGLSVTSSFTSAPRTSSVCVANSVTDYVFHPLRNEYGFANQLNRLTGPFSLTMSTGTASTYGAVWIDADGLTQTVGTGVAAGTISRVVEGGRIVFDPLTLHAIDQDIIWEGGGLIRSQSDGAMVIQSPNFDMRVSGSTGYLRWTVIDLSGTGDISGAGQGSVVMTMTGMDEQLISAPSGSIVIHSVNTPAWQNFLEAEIMVAGADASASIAPGPNQLTLNLNSAGGVTNWIVHYRVISATTIVGG